MKRVQSLCLVGLLALVVAGLAGCSIAPAVSDIREDMVRIQAEHRIWDMKSEAEQKKEIDGKARSACALYDRQPSQQLSQRCLQRESLGWCLVSEALYACTPTAP